ncbi:MAG: class I SAM-dependent methyltransferase [Kiloniellales bacterium]|nr:class I SAM-dependent methyltransferase [Kiloniellales bacterium]
MDVRAFRCTSSGYGHHFQIVQCKNCGHVYANPRRKLEEILAAYSAVEDETYLEERGGRERTFLKHLKELEKYTGPGEHRPLLDVGAYVGIFVEVARSNQWCAVGVEPSQWATLEAQKLDLPVFLGTMEAAALDNRRFDVITMWDVIEHMDDPAAEVKRAFGLLNPGGFIAIHTMDINSFIAKVMGRRWPWLMDMHIHYFGRRTLIRLLELNGFEVIWIGSQGRYLSLRSLVSRIGGISPPVGRFMRKIVNLLKCGDLTVPVNFGDLITVYAKKPET